MREILSRLVASDAVSAVTPTEYEENGRQFLISEMESYFGLGILSDARVRRLDKEILYDSDKSMEWDFRVPVKVCSAPASRSVRSSDLFIYPDQERYIRPGRPDGGSRQLTPTKIGADDAAPACHYMAVFEITTSKYWTDKLLARLETRLRITLERARALTAEVRNILDACAVVGVVSPYSVTASVTSKVKEGALPLLFQMMTAGRFVCLRRDYNPSP